MASQMTITQNLLNCLNRIDTDVQATDAVVDPTSFSNAPNVDDGRNIICMQGISSGIVNGAWDHTADPTTQRLVRLGRGGKLITGPQYSEISSQYPRIWTPSLERQSNSEMLNFWLDMRQLFSYMNDPSLNNMGFGRINRYISHSGWRFVYNVALIQGQNTFSIGTVDFTGKMLVFPANGYSIQRGVAAGAQCIKITQLNQSDLTQLDSVVLSCYCTYNQGTGSSTTYPLPMPIMAAVSLSSPVALEYNDTVQITLNIASSYSPA